MEKKLKPMTKQERITLYKMDLEFYNKQKKYEVRHYKEIINKLNEKIQKTKQKIKEVENENN